MTVMIDELLVWPHAKPPFHKGSCHLTVDDDTPEAMEDLHAFAAKLGLRRSWFQDKLVAHYDLTPGKRALAQRLGAVFVPGKEQARARRARPA